MESKNIYILIIVFAILFLLLDFVVTKLHFKLENFSNTDSPALSPSLSPSVTNENSELRQALGKMRNNQFGRIVHISSVNGQKGQFGQSNYAATKSALIGFSKSSKFLMQKYRQRLLLLQTYSFFL